MCTEGKSEKLFLAGFDLLTSRIIVRDTATAPHSLYAVIPGITYVYTAAFSETPDTLPYMDVEPKFWRPMVTYLGGLGSKIFEAWSC